MRALRPMFFAFAWTGIALGACASPDDASTADSPGDAEQAAEQDLNAGAKLSPFTLQFVGVYRGGGAGTSITVLDLRPDGSYALTRADGSHEEGRFSGGRKKTTPLTVRFRDGAHGWSGRIAGWDGKLAVRGETLTLDRPAASDEDECDATQGSWRDDDADPTTGLYCVCAAGHVFVPSAGGCISGAATDRLTPWCAKDTLACPAGWSCSAERVYDPAADVPGHAELGFDGLSCGPGGADDAWCPRYCERAP